MQYTKIDIHCQEYIRIKKGDTCVIPIAITSNVPCLKEIGLFSDSICIIKQNLKDISFGIMNYNFIVDTSTSKSIYKYKVYAIGGSVLYSDETYFYTEKLFTVELLK